MDEKAHSILFPGGLKDVPYDGKMSSDAGKILKKFGLLPAKGSGSKKNSVSSERAAGVDSVELSNFMEKVGRATKRAAARGLMRKVGRAVTKTSNEDFESKHPRDEYGRFAKKDDRDALEPDAVSSAIDKLQDDLERLVGTSIEVTDGDYKNTGVTSVVKIGDRSYHMVGKGVTVQDVVDMHMIFEDGGGKLVESGYDDFEDFSDIAVIGTDDGDLKDFRKHIVANDAWGLTGHETKDIADGIVAKAKSRNGMIAAVYHDGPIVLDNGLIRGGRQDILESIVVHELIHRRTREGDIGLKSYDAHEENYTTILSMKLYEEYGLPEMMGYPAYVGAALIAAEKTGWSKEKFYEFANEAHYRNSIFYTFSHSALMKEAGLYGKGYYRDASTNAAITEWFGSGWHDTWNDIGEIYDWDEDMMSLIHGEGYDEDD